MPEKQFVPKLVVREVIATLMERSERLRFIWNNEYTNTGRRELVDLTHRGINQGLAIAPPDRPPTAQEAENENRLHAMELDDEPDRQIGAIVRSVRELEEEEARAAASKRPVPEYLKAKDVGPPLEGMQKLVRTAVFNLNQALEFAREHDVGVEIDFEDNDAVIKTWIVGEP